MLNKHWASLSPEAEVAPELSRLFLLGYVSAVEGYMRSLIRRLVHCDTFTQNCCEPLQLSYRAVLHHEPDALPDALLEETNFSTTKSIPQALSKFVGMPTLSAGTTALLAEFDMICQLRHCCTHRFGKLGVKNAAELGLSSHSKFLEKPILLKKSAMADIADLTFTLVKSINNDVFGYVMKRSATGKLASSDAHGVGWTWHKAKDKARFQSYYNIFCSRKDATPSPSADVVYELFRKSHRMVGKPKKGGK
ncbi:hypothetical protein QTI24_30680 [Variovorax sp. J22P240]|uniref:hypothetical protein n=1 Tax=Variovorax sp. J22P240 TaxID=3053514 RepID=UPI00257786DC|nr:hypothetical protein [Variovorax sp. J22P240]MDM0002986.1 hypothetical protein [Variovorax sp. J22P240]